MPSYLRFTPFTSGAAVRRRLTVLCALAGLACGGAPGPQSVSPQSMNQTLDQFFAAVKANDLQRMGALWGTERGPANDWMKSDELRQRLSVIQRYLAHVGYRVIEGPLVRSEEHTSELQSLAYLVCRLLLEKKKIQLRVPAVSRMSLHG